MASRIKNTGKHWEWKFCRMINDNYPNKAFTWHIGGSAPGFDALIFKGGHDGQWQYVIPIEIKSFKKPKKNYTAQVLDQYLRYMKLYNENGILTFYALRHKGISRGEEEIDKWRLIPCTCILYAKTRNKTMSLDYNWKEAMPLRRAMQIIMGTHKAKKTELKKWKWLVRE